MSDKAVVVVACDINTGQDSAFQNAVCSKLESAGFTVEKLPIGPGYFSSYSYSSKSQGKIGVFIIAPATFSIADYHYGANKNKKSFKMGVFGIRGDFNSKMKGSNWDNVPIGRDADYRGLPTDIVGKTFKQMNEMLKDDIRIVKGETPEEMAKNVLAAIGGNVDDDEGSSASTIKEALRDVLSPLDGEVECKVINDKVYVNKIPEPEASHTLELLEGINIINDSISITDYNPDTINKLVVHWNNGEDIIYINDELIDRFGEKVSELDAVKTITVTETNESSSETTSTETDTTNDDSSSNESKTTTSTKEVPVETYEEALNFAKIEWAKIRRDNGHIIECRVNASPEWRQGEWVKVYIPSFNEKGFMYITKVSQSISPSNNQCNLTLSDYPPSLGEPKENSEDDSEEDEEETTEEETE